ncbi:MAG: Smr domain protein [Myxococcales bacterium]|nr:Smr domain protein [Myxococcales bacterium]
MGKKSKGFNTPFEELEALRKALIEKERAENAQKLAAKRAPPPPPSPAAKPDKPEEEVFADEMRDVAPLEADPRGRVIGGAAPPVSAPRRRLNDDAEAYAELADLVEGAGNFDITATDEYIEGLGPGIDKKLLRKLRAGDYALQAHLDLHGFTAEQARPEVEKFLIAARKESRRCVLIIHGRGHNSKEGIPILKERLKVWLTRGRIGHGVLAFCTARPTDGGAGAVYVLLRKF